MKTIKLNKKEIIVNLSYAKVDFSAATDKTIFSIYDENRDLLYSADIENEEDLKLLHEMFHKKVDIYPRPK